MTRPADAAFEARRACDVDGEGARVEARRVEDVVDLREQQLAACNGLAQVELDGARLDRDGGVHGHLQAGTSVTAGAVVPLDFWPGARGAPRSTTG